jgi:hypothetical protein
VDYQRVAEEYMARTEKKLEGFLVSNVTA